MDGGIASVLLVGFVVGFVALAVVDTTALFVLVVLPVLAAIATFGALVMAVLVWRDGYWGILGRLHYTLVVLAGSSSWAYFATGTCSGSSSDRTVAGT